MNTLNEMNTFVFFFAHSLLQHMFNINVVREETRSANLNASTDISNSSRTSRVATSHSGMSEKEMLHVDETTHGVAACNRRVHVPVPSTWFSMRRFVRGACRKTWIPCINIKQLRSYFHTTTQCISAVDI